MQYWVRAPDHLGDGVMALPAVAALASLHATTVHGPGWVEDLYGHTGASRGAPRPAPNDVAVLFKPSFSAAWTARGAARRVGLAGDGRRWLLTEVVWTDAVHRTHHYNAIASMAGAVPCGAPSLPAASRHEPIPDLPERAVLLLPCSPSGPPVRWPHFRTLADALGGRAIFAAGPGEDDELAGIAGPHPRLPALTIPAFAAVSARVAAVVGNDSGLSHLAAAARRGAGRDVADVHVLYGSTDPGRTGPEASTRHVWDSPHCWPCYSKTCWHDLECMGVPVTTVLAALRAA